MLSRFRAFFRPPEFSEDEEKNRRARALNALQVNMGVAIFVMGESDSC